MPRTAKSIDRITLVKIINQIQQENNYEGATHFWKIVEATYRQQTGESVSFQTLKSRSEEWGISAEIQKAGRGRGSAEALKRAREKAGGVVRRKKKPNNDNIEAMRDRLIDHKQTNLLPLVDKVVNGSKMAAIKLHCLDCCHYSRKDIKLCTSKACALFSLRPYQNSTDPDSEMEEDDDVS